VRLHWSSNPCRSHARRGSTGGARLAGLPEDGICCASLLLLCWQSYSLSIPCTLMLNASSRRTRLALVVDDDAAVRLYVRAVLLQLDFETLEAADGMEALELLRGRDGAVDVLVTDVQMPKMSGLELAEAVRAEFRAVPLVVMSGSSGAASLGQPIEFIQKPFLPNTLLASVDKVVARSTSSAFPTPRCKS
jgi:CheY-like chemotaxis protein